jgi:superfamily II DNA or RNA helicase
MLGRFYVHYTDLRFVLEVVDEVFPRVLESALASVMGGAACAAPNSGRAGVSIPASLETIRLINDEFSGEALWTQPAEREAARIIEAAESAHRAASAPRAAVPPLACVTKTLRGYQTLAVDMGVRVGRFILALDPGLGKTLAALYIVLVKMARGEVTRALVIAPKRRPWIEELSAMVGVSWQVIGRGEKEPPYINEHPFTLVTSEQLLTHLADGRVKREELARFDAVIIDEPIRLANSANVTYGCFKEVFRDCPTLMLLNGTPIETRLRELYDQVDFVSEGFLGPWGEFSSRYVGMPTTPRVRHPMRREALLSQLHGVLFRRTMEDVADELPPLVFQTHIVGMTDSQEAIYGKLSRELAESPESALGILIRMQQAVDDAALAASGEHSSAKLDALDALLPSLTMWGRKAIIFTQFEEWASFIAARYADAGAVAYTGKTPPNEKARIEEAFAGDADVRILVTTSAGGRALSFPRTHYVVILDNLWCDMGQLIARARRITTDHPVGVITILSGTPFEEYKAQVIAEKKEAFKDSLMDALPRLLKSGALDLKLITGHMSTTEQKEK